MKNLYRSCLIFTSPLSSHWTDISPCIDGLVNSFGSINRGDGQRGSFGKIFYVHCHILYSIISPTMMDPDVSIFFPEIFQTNNIFKQITSIRGMKNFNRFALFRINYSFDV